jgi:hypothetical protein
MKKILSFKGFETLNERILIPSDEDKRLKEEVFPKLVAMLKDKSLWTTLPQFLDHRHKNYPIENSIPFKYKMASGEEAEVRFFVGEDEVFRKAYATFYPRIAQNLKDNLIGVNGDESDRLLRNEGRGLLSILKHELIHAKDPGMNQYDYSEKHKPKNKAKYREKYYETKPEGLAFGGQFIEEVKDALDDFLKESPLTEEKIKTLNSVLNTLATRTTGSIHPVNPSKEVSSFLKYDNSFKRVKDLLAKDPNLDPILVSSTISRLKAAGNPEFQKFQKKLYQELLKIADKVNLILSQKYPDIKGRIKITSSAL